MTLLAGGLASTSALAVVASLLVSPATEAVALAADVAMVAVAGLLRRRPGLPLVASRRLLLRANAVLRRAPDRGAVTLERWVGQLGPVRSGARDWTVALTHGSGTTRSGRRVPLSVFRCRRQQQWRPALPGSSKNVCPVCGRANGN